MSAGAWDKTMGIYMAIGNVDCWKVGNEVVSVKSPKKKIRSTEKKGPNGWRVFGEFGD